MSLLSRTTETTVTTIIVKYQINVSIVIKKSYIFSQKYYNQQTERQTTGLLELLWAAKSHKVLTLKKNRSTDIFNNIDHKFNKKIRNEC